MPKVRKPLSCNTLDNESGKFTENSKCQVAIRTVTEICGDSAGYWEIFKEKLSCLDYDSVKEEIKDNYRYIFLIDSSTNTAVGGFKITNASPYTGGLINVGSDIAQNLTTNFVEILEDSSELQFGGNGVLLSPTFNTKPEKVDCIQSYTVRNISVAALNTISSFQISSDVKRFEIRHRNGGKIEFSEDMTLSTYFTIRKGMVFSEQGLCLTSNNVYYRSNKLGTIEILEWR